MVASLPQFGNIFLLLFLVRSPPYLPPYHPSLPPSLPFSLSRLLET